MYRFLYRKSIRKLQKVVKIRIRSSRNHSRKSVFFRTFEAHKNLNQKRNTFMADIALINEIRDKAVKVKRTLVLPESHDDRVLRAAEFIQKEKIASVITLGNEEKIRARAKELELELTGVRVIDPEKSDKLSDFANIFYNLRKHKGMTIEEAHTTMKRDIFFGAMMLREGMAHASVSGSFASTGDVMRAGILCIGTKEGVSIVSSSFLMAFPEKTYTFADCAVIPDPDANQLADIAAVSADTHQRLTGEKPVVALLSFSTKGSAEHKNIDKVREALRIVKEKHPDLLVDGELQFDAAVVEGIGQKKAPGSQVAGKANVLIFPDLQSGNIGYKIAQRWGKAEAIGPVSQGLKLPFFDLSRGCSVDDIITTSAIALLMA